VISSMPNFSRLFPPVVKTGKPVVKPKKKK
jgi:hypothetical protein